MAGPLPATGHARRRGEQCRRLRVGVKRFFDIFLRTKPLVVSMTVLSTNNEPPDERARGGRPNNVGARSGSG